MIRTVYIWIFLIYFILKCNSVRRGGTSKSRVGAHSYSAGNTANEDPGRAILAIIFMLLTCGGGIGWKIYRCIKQNQQRKSRPIAIPYPNNIYLNPLSSKLITERYPSISFEQTSEKQIDCLQTVL